MAHKIVSYWKFGVCVCMFTLSLYFIMLAVYTVFLQYAVQFSC